MSIRLEHGDCREVVKSLADCSIDSCVTDPPYSLVSIQKRFGKPGSAPAQEGRDGLYRRASAGFMGQQWDTGETAFDPDWWRDVYRVLKPGAHLVAFSGTRTYHRMACSIEDAGFEIRDQLAWAYGSGFPKSHNVGKAIDRQRQDNPDWRRVGAWLRERRQAAKLSAKALCGAIGAHGSINHGGAVSNWEMGLACPTWDQWVSIKAALGFSEEMDAEVWRLNGRKGKPGENWKVIGTRDATCATGSVYGEFSQRVEINEPTDIARQWSGWGTAIKPSWEPICLARKPLEGTVAANVLQHGVGALNIDGCRVGTSKDVPASHSNAANNVYGAASVRDENRSGMDPSIGRWPANLVHDGSEEVLDAFAQFGTDKGAAAPVTRRGSDKFRTAYGKFKGNTDESGSTFQGDTGSAARFFFSAKADADDRWGSKHPTVKPVDLMRWLARLVTPPGGLVLDPFAGSGTTGVACLSEGFRAILIERESEYISDIKARLDHYAGKGGHSLAVKQRNADPKKATGADTPLFSGLQ